MEPRGSGMCPEGTRRTDRGWIKAGLAALVAGVMGGGVLALAGGSDEPRKIKSDGVAATPAGAAEAPAPPDPPEGDPEVGEKVEMGDDGGSVSVLAVEDNVSAGRLLDAGEGQKFVAAEVKGCSGPSEQNITFEPAYFLLRLDDGTIRDSGIGAKKPSLEGGTIPAGKCLNGWVTFTVPEGALPTGVVYDGSTRTIWTVPIPENAKQTTTTTMKPGATTSTTADPDDSDDPDTTSTTRSKATATTTTAKKATSPSSTTATTARKTTPTTARATGSTSTTATTGRSSSGSTGTTTATKTTSTTAPAKASTTTTTTGANVEADPADQPG